MASLIKAVLSLVHESIPPNLHFQKLNPYIDQKNVTIEIPVRPTDWIAPRGRRLAGVNSFGFGGTNCHIIVSDAPLQPPATVPQPPHDRPQHILALSARDPWSLAALAGRYATGLQQPDVGLADFCYAANTGRSQLELRRTVTGNSARELIDQLQVLPAADVGTESGTARRARRRNKIVFLFTGQGSQYAGMGRLLYETQPTYRASIDRSARILQQHQCPLLDVLWSDDRQANKSHAIQNTQPALFAVEYALFELWQSWGIQPDFAIGHSMGEYVAACAAGVFSLEDGLRLITARARLMQSLPIDGAMLAITADEAKVASLIAPHSARLSIAADNGPQQTVISGAAEIIDRIADELRRQGVGTTRLPVSHAFHSPLMEPILDAFAKLVSTIPLRAPRFPIALNLTGELSGNELQTADYWQRQLRRPVQFARGIATLQSKGANLFVEVGPQPVLSALGQICAAGRESVWLPSLRRGHDDWRTLLHSLGELFEHGVRVNWQGFDRDYPRQRVDLPTYPFHRSRFWAPDSVVASPQVDAAAAAVRPGAETSTHPLLGRRVPAAVDEIIYETRLSTQQPAYLRDHRLFDQTVLPAAGYVEMALSAVRELFHTDHVQLQSLQIHQPLVLAEDGAAATLQLLLAPEGDAAASFRILSREKLQPDAAIWRLHAAGRISPLLATADAHDVDTTAMGTQPSVDIPKFYQACLASGLHYGPAFQGLRQLNVGPDDAIAEVALPSPLIPEVDQYTLHPALLDACLQSVGSLLHEQPHPGCTYVPVGLRAIRLHTSLAVARGRVHTRIVDRRGGKQPQLTADLMVLADDGTVLVEVEGLRLLQIARGDLQRRLYGNLDQWLHCVVWRETPRLGMPLPAQTDAEPVWLIVGKPSALRDGVGQQLRERNQRCVLAAPGLDYMLQGDQATFDAQDARHFDRLFQELKLTRERPLRGVLLLAHSHDKGDVDLQLLDCQTALYLIQALGRLEDQSPRLYLVTRGGQQPTAAGVGPRPDQTALWGLARVVAAEMPKLNCTRIDLDTDETEDASRLFGELWVPDQETEIAIRGPLRYCSRLVPRDMSPPASLRIPAQPYRLGLSKYGVLDNLIVREIERTEPGAGQVEIAVHAAGLNFRDVLRALGMLQPYEQVMGIHNEQDVTFGFEGAGKVTRVGPGVRNYRPGDAVLALATASLGSHLTVDTRYVAPVPKGWSVEEAASVPLAYLTAWYGLVRLARLKSGDRVLIHAAAGGVGQAAVALAQSIGAEIYATASQGKQDFLREQGIEHIYDSRTTQFAQQLLADTQGRGVDVVLNSFNQEFIPKSVEALAPGGRFVEIGKLGIWTPEEFAAARPDAQYLPFDLGQQELQRPGLIGELLAELLPQFNSGQLPPLPFETFAIREAVAAFRHLQQARHRGKVVIQVQPPRPQPPVVRPDATYLITGGVGALGLQAAGWLVSQGARHLVLAHRSDRITDAARERIAVWEQMGAKIVTHTLNVGDRAQVALLLQSLQQTMPPLRGILHAAGVLQDATLPQQSWTRFQQVLEPKVAGAWNLHALTQTMELDWFVCYSSIASVLGSPGQANYATANAFLDGLMQYRRHHQLPGLSIQWGPWSGGGMTAGQDTRRWDQMGLETITPSAGLLLLDILLPQDDASVGVFPVDWPRFLRQFPREQLPRLLVELFALHAAPAAARVDSAPRQRILAAGERERPRLIYDLVANDVARTLGVSAAALDRDRPLSQMGLDSLMGIELKNAIESKLAIEIPLERFTTETTVSQLAEMIQEFLGVEGSVPQEPAVSEVAESAKAARPLDTIGPSDYDVREFPELRELQQRLAFFASLGIDNPYFDVHERVTADTAVIRGRVMINFSSYNYLGSSGAAEVCAAAQAAIKQFGTSVSASRVVSGEKTIHGELELAIARFLGTEDAVVFVGGHSTNESTIGHLLKPGDLVLHDELAHNSIIQGCLLSGAQRRAFPHNDAAACAKMLAEMRGHYRRAMVAIEGVYSMDGDYPDLPQFVAAKDRYKALLFVDEAHSIGTMGRTGRGIVEHFGMRAEQVDLLMGTLSKSLGSCGGYIASRKELITYLKYTAPGFVYSVGLSPPNAAAALAAIRRIEQHPEIVARCIANSTLFLQLAQERGLNTGTSNCTPVVPVIIGSSLLSLKLSRQLYARGINVQPILYPAVEEKATRLRFFITSEHSAEQIRCTVEATAEELARLMPSGKVPHQDQFRASE